MNSEERLRKTLGERFGNEEFEFDPLAWEDARQLIDEKRSRRRYAYLVPLVLAISGALVYFAVIPYTDNVKVIVANEPMTESVQSVQPAPERVLRAQPQQQQIASQKTGPFTLQNVKRPNGPPVAQSEKRIEEIPEEKQPETAHVNTEPVKAGLPEITSAQVPAQVTPPEMPEAAVAEPPAVAAAEQVRHQEEIVVPAKSEPSPVPVIEPTVANAGTAVPPDSMMALLRAAESNRPAEGIFYEAGLSALAGWNYDSRRDGAGINPVAGIHYYNTVGEKSGFSFGVQYTSVSRMNYSTRVSKVSSYRFGEESQVTAITPASAHYIVIPLKFHYCADQRNAYGAGMNFGYLLNVNAKVETYDENVSGTRNHIVTTLGGYTQGYNWMDAQVAVHYRRMMAGRLAIQGELFFGLTDVKNDVFFSVTKKERNTGIKLSLIYYGFKWPANAKN
jgi:hypothetical protein